LSNSEAPIENRRWEKSDMKVWIDHDLCTGDGFFHVEELETNLGAMKVVDGATNAAGSNGMAGILEGGLERSSNRLSVSW
jgi:hypothetical protein